MSTKIVNLALRHLGNSNEIADYTTDRSQEARAARAFFDIALEETLRDCALPITRRRQTLGLVEYNPTQDYAYSFRIPANCLKVRGAVMPMPIEYYAGGVQALQAYQITSDDHGGLILTNINNFQLEFIAKIENTDILPSDFIMALSFKLAFYMAPSITGGDPNKRGAQAGQTYLIWVDKAKASAYNEEPSKPAPQSELVTAHYYSFEAGGYPVSGRSDA